MKSAGTLVTAPLYSANVHDRRLSGALVHSLTLLSDMASSGSTAALLNHCWHSPRASKPHALICGLSAGTPGSAEVRNALRKLLRTIVNQPADGSSQPPLLLFVSSLLKAAPTCAGFCADVLQDLILKESTTAEFPGIAVVLHQLARARPVFLARHVHGLLQRDTRFLYDETVLSFLLRHNRTVVLPYITGQVILPLRWPKDKGNAPGVPFGEHTVQELAGMWTLPAQHASECVYLQPAEQEAVANSLVRLLSTESVTASAAANVQDNVLDLLMRLPDISTAPLRALMAADNPQREARDALLNAVHAHPSVADLFDDLLAALADDRANAAIVSVTACLSQRPVAAQLEALSSIVIRTKRAVVLKQVMSMYGSIYDPSNGAQAEEAMCARAALVTAASNVKYVPDVRLMALQPLCRVDFLADDIQEVVLAVLTQEGAPEALLAGAVHAALGSGSSEVRYFPVDCGAALIVINKQTECPNVQSLSLIHI